MGAVFYLPSSLEYQTAHLFALAEQQDGLVLGVLYPVTEGRLALLYIATVVGLEEGNGALQHKCFILHHCHRVEGDPGTAEPSLKAPPAPRYTSS